MIFSELEKYRQGHFSFTTGDSLRIVSKEVPDLHGVYYVSRLAKGNDDIVYIGKSGTILQNGSCKKQTLRVRINNIHEKMRRESYFKQKIETGNIDTLTIHWFITFYRDSKDLPGYIEGLMMQQYFDIYKKLPDWNKEF
ncbi:MAG TPA: hypothetical protein VN721_07790 [Flavipsychrobacter sp.]|nr:hypothetical protein [Flavipsychrobacter sp.]